MENQRDVVQGRVCLSDHVFRLIDRSLSLSLSFSLTHSLSFFILPHQSLSKIQRIMTEPVSVFFGIPVAWQTNLFIQLLESTQLHRLESLIAGGPPPPPPPFLGGGSVGHGRSSVPSLPSAPHCRPIFVTVLLPFPLLSFSLQIYHATLSIYLSIYLSIVLLIPFRAVKSVPPLIMFAPRSMNREYHSGLQDSTLA